MISKQYFFVRPTETAIRRFQELGINDEEELTTPLVWAQDLDLRVTVSAEDRDWCVRVATIHYIAYILSELESLGVPALSDVPVDELTKFWSVEWIDGGVLDVGDIESELSPSVLHRLLSEIVDPDVASALENLSLRAGD